MEVDEVSKLEGKDLQGKKQKLSSLNNKTISLITNSYYQIRLLFRIITCHVLSHLEKSKYMLYHQKNIFFVRNV